jgi:hypothetical protein
MPGLAWKPDSSGFIYTDKDATRLMEFDLKTKKSTIVAITPSTRTTYPAMRPDGKRYALARCENRKGLLSRLQVILYTPEGNEDRKSSWFDLQGKVGERNEVIPAYLYWATPDRILIVSESICIYDMEKNRLITVEPCLPWFVGGPPWRPDGKGFLAFKEQQGKIEVSFVDWDGKKQPLDETLSGKEGNESLPFLAGWEKDIALLQTPEGIYEADTARKTLRKSKRKPIDVLESAGKRLACHVFPGNGVAVCTIRCTEKTPTGERQFDRIEVHDLAGLTRKVIVDECVVVPMLFPSPDRKKVAMIYTRPPHRDDQKIVVVAASGKVLSEVQYDR